MTEDEMTRGEMAAIALLLKNAAQRAPLNINPKRPIFTFTFGKLKVSCANTQRAIISMADKYAKPAPWIFRRPHIVKASTRKKIPRPPNADQILSELEDKS